MKSLISSLCGKKGQRFSSRMIFRQREQTNNVHGLITVFRKQVSCNAQSEKLLSFNAGGNENIHSPKTWIYTFIFALEKCQLKSYN